MKESTWEFALAGLVPAISFWMLDAYYLRLERAFRELYKCVANAGAASGATGANFQMDISTHLKNGPSVWAVAKSESAGWLHIPLVIALCLGAWFVCHHKTEKPEPAVEKTKATVMRFEPVGRLQSSPWHVVS